MPGPNFRPQRLNKRPRRRAKRVFFLSSLFGGSIAETDQNYLISNPKVSTSVARERLHLVFNNMQCDNLFFNQEGYVILGEC